MPKSQNLASRSALSIAVPSGKNWVNHPRWHPRNSSCDSTICRRSQLAVLSDEWLEFVPPGFSTSTTRKVQLRVLGRLFSLMGFKAPYQKLGCALKNHVEIQIHVYGYGMLWYPKKSYICLWHNGMFSGSFFHSKA